MFDEDDADGPSTGPETVRQYQGVPPYKETRGYVKRVLKLYKKYHADFR